MKPAGIAAYAKREESRSKIYAYENNAAEFSDEFEKQFQANEKAWEFFQKQAASYRNRAIYWTMNAKQDLTARNRLAKLINVSANGEKI